MFPCYNGYNQQPKADYAIDTVYNGNCMLLTNS